MHSLMAEGATFIDSVDFSSITDMANSVAGKAVPVIVAIMTIVISVKLVKKFGNKIG